MGPGHHRWTGIDSAALERAIAAATAGRSIPPEAVMDLELSAACALGHPEAIAELDLVLREEVARAVRPMNAALVDEAIQAVRERLLLPGPEGRRRIGEFRAEGSLRGWLRAIATRIALNLQRAAGPIAAEGDELLAELPFGAADAELELFRARYREVFREAFAASVQALTSHDRTVLRLHTLDGVTLAKIGAMYRKDTSTISRWLEKIRQTLRESTRAELASRLALSPSELESIQRAADFELSVSLARLLE